VLERHGDAQVLALLKNPQLKDTQVSSTLDKKMENTMAEVRRQAEKARGGVGGRENMVLGFFWRKIRILLQGDFFR
jgi:hypothetical protein